MYFEIIANSGWTWDGKPYENFAIGCSGFDLTVRGNNAFIIDKSTDYKGYYIDISSNNITNSKLALYVKSNKSYIRLAKFCTEKPSGKYLGSIKDLEQK